MKTLKQAPANYKKLPDEELVFRFAERHEQIALFCLFERYGHLVMGVCTNDLGNAQLAKKTTEEIFIRLATELQRFKTDNFKAWLFDLVNAHCNKQITEKILAQEGYHSSCLTKRQMEFYVTGTITNDELSAVETHTSSCVFCNCAANGLKVKDENLAVLKVLNSDFLKEYFSFHFPHIHLNSITTAKPLTAQHKYKSKKHKKHALQPSSIAAIILLAGGIFWYNESGKNLLHGLNRVRTAKAPLQTIEANSAVKAMGDKAVNIIPATVVNEKKPEEISTAHKVHQIDKVQEQKLMATRNAVKEKPGTAIKKRGGLWSIFNGSGKGDDSEEKKSKGDEHFEKGEYKAAISSYKNEMKTDDETQRHEAGIMAAQSYINLGENDKAAKILQGIVDEGGAEKRTAKRILNNINEEQ